MQCLLGKRVYLDTNVFIYAVEPTESMQPLFEKVTRLFELALNQQLIAMTSELSLAEVLVGAYKTSSALVKIYEGLLRNRPELAVYAIDRDVLRHVARLRSQQKISLADAIHLSTALIHQADIFISHDKRISSPVNMLKFTLEDLHP